MKGQSFVRGAVILSMAGLASKMMGALYRIPLARLIGGEGLGLYQMAYPLYTMILAVSTAGIPVAISILIAEKQALGDYRSGMRIFKIALFILATTGAFSSWLLYTASHSLASTILNDSRAAFAIMAISPAIFFTAINSAFRGYFQGHRNMVPTALSQVVEQFARVTTVLVAAYFLLPYGVEFSAAGATFGAVVGSIFSLIVLLACFIFFPGEKDKRNVYKGKREGVFAVTGKIIYLALPLSLGGLVMPVMQMIDATIVPLRLQAAGFDMVRATELFGQLAGMANTLINLPTIITVSLAVSLVPAISEAAAQKRKLTLENRINTACRLTLLLGLPSAAGLWVLAEPISLLLYDIAEVAVPLKVLAPATLFLGLYQTTAAVLQGMGKTYFPVRNLLTGAIIKIALNYWLTALPAFGIRGAAFSSVCGFFGAFLLNYLQIKKLAGFKVTILKTAAGPFISSAAMALAVYKFYDLLNTAAGNTIATLLSVFSGVVIYGCLVLLLGLVRAEELETIPVVGTKIARSALKLGLVRR